MALVAVTLPAWGPSLPLDFLTVNPLRHGTLIPWSRVSSWWKEAWRLWHSLQWPVTWADLPTQERFEYAVLQPVWWNGDSLFGFEPKTRTSAALVHRRSLGMVVEPQRSFRRHIARVFQLRACPILRLMITTGQRAKTLLNGTSTTCTARLHRISSTSGCASSIVK